MITTDTFSARKTSCRAWTWDKGQEDAEAKVSDCARVEGNACIKEFTAARIHKRAELPAWRTASH